jgi:hypothetical protein
MGKRGSMLMDWMRDATWTGRGSAGAGRLYYDDYDSKK